MAKVNGEDGGQADTATINLHSCEVTVAMGAGGRCISNISVSNREEDGSITKSNFIVKQDAAADRTDKSTKYTLAINRKEVVYSVKKCSVRSDSVETPENSDQDSDSDEAQKESSRLRQGGGPH